MFKTNETDNDEKIHFITLQKESPVCVLVYGRVTRFLKAVIIAVLCWCVTKVVRWVCITLDKHSSLKLGLSLTLSCIVLSIGHFL